METNFTTNVSNLTNGGSTPATPSGVDAPMSSLDIGLLVSYVLVFLVGISGNTLVCLMFKMSNGKLKVMETMICCLAITDLIASIINPSLYTYWQVTRNRSWHFGWLGCKMLPIFNRSVTNVSFGIIMLINIDRSIVITRPFRPKMNKKHVKYAVGVIAVIAVLLEIPFIYHVQIVPGLTCVVPDSKVPGFAYPALSLILLRLTLFFFAFLITVVCIYRELYNEEDLKTLKEQKRLENNKTVLIMLSTIAIIFILLVFPRDFLHVIYIFSLFVGKEMPYNAVLRNINATCKVLHMCNSICNVFIYAGLHRRFRRDVKRKVSTAIIARTNAFRVGHVVHRQHHPFKVVESEDGPIVVSASPYDQNIYGTSDDRSTTSTYSFNRSLNYKRRGGRTDNKRVIPQNGPIVVTATLYDSNIYCEDTSTSTV